MSWKTCNHKWTSVPQHSAYGVFFRDECECCGSIGIIATEPDENGLYKIVAMPQAEVIDLKAFRQKKGVV